MIPASACAADPFWQEMASITELSGHPLIMRAETVSTNSDALELGRRGAPSGTVVIARSQTGGRGRLGKTWLSPADSGLYFSMLMRPSLDPADLPKITLAAGVALYRAVRPFCHPAPMMKWPNDLLLNGKKCGGILTESEFNKDPQPLVVLGIGLNVSTPPDAFPQELQGKITSLIQHSQRPICRTTLLKGILTAIDTIMTRMEAGNFAAILDEWRSFDATKGRRLTWVTTGRQAVTGISLGPDNQGRLHIRDDQGRTHEVLSGDIRLQSF
ncbi:MAG: biotin--[acetyl-CoA-carboxylase] ligase [Proteobacteria bacterium]|nr:biotin--[acetyl-CoA-carboxylase] ligase [Pseudomonadota bacterium]MBU4295789.1 biotin--[acetyl-CoA-carboxylase] ligase [Pseudomonadota bacterium]MCG2747814.1 biotin--[acetyl-CoA-carboxylase] ligase [Desulfobulbaceae bacterium]